MRQKGPPAGEVGNIILIFLVILLVVAVGVFLLISKGIVKNPFQKTSLGGQIFNQAQNPISGKIPQINPLEKTKINPFKNIYPNPFDRMSK